MKDFLDTTPFAIVIIIFAITIEGILGMAFGMASCSNHQTDPLWNNGICPKCGVNYELRAKYYSKIYVCPECHTEVERY